MKPWRMIVDLSHPIFPQIPTWPGDPRPAFSTLATVAGQGYSLRQVTLGEHTGTHLGTAAHLQDDGLTVERLDAAELIVPAAVVDVRSLAAADADYALSLDEMARWEARHGRIPADRVVLLATGWDARWLDEVAYLNRDAEGVMHFPGFAPQTVQWLVEERSVRGVGIDTAGIDPGCDTAFRSNQQLLQGRRFHLENLTQLDRLPPTGAWLFIGALPLVGGTGSPARVIAFVPL